MLARIAKAADACNLLEGMNVSLLAAVGSFLHAHKLRTTSVTLLVLLDQFLDTKVDRNPEYLRKLCIPRDRFSHFRERLVSDISHFEFGPLLTAPSSGSRNAVMRCLRAIFNYGIKRGYFTDDPIACLDFAEWLRREVVTIPNEQVAAMLNHAFENNLDLLPFLKFVFFAGIRSEGELQELKWRDVGLTNHVVVIWQANRCQFVDLNPSAAEWIRAFRQQGRKRESCISPFTLPQLQIHRQEHWKTAGIKARPQQGYASHVLLELAGNS